MTENAGRTRHALGRRTATGRGVESVIEEEFEDEFQDDDEPVPSVGIAILLIAAALVLTYVAVPLFT